jgi:hypothetical protein
MSLEQSNTIVRDALTSVQDVGDTILGLLPIEEESQEQVINAVRDAVHGNRSLMVASLNGPHRAAVAYAIAIVRASSDEGVSSWQALESRLGVTIPSQPTSVRQEFSNLFKRICRYLQLDVGEIGKHANEAPILYQAGILKHWVRPLCTGIRITLEEVPAANPDDEEYLERFCRRIGSRIPRSHQTLIDCIGNAENQPKPLGILIIKKLLKARLLGLEQQLPPHLREPIMEAMASVSNRRQIYPPYMHFDAVDGVLSVILPKQNPDLLTSVSVWELNQKTMSPHREQRWHINDTGNRSVDVTLKNLSGTLGEIPFSILTEIGGAVPFRFFDARSGRDIKVRTNAPNSILLPPGSYHILADATLQVEGLSVFERVQIGGSSLNRSCIEVRYNDPVRKITIGDVTREIIVKQDPGLYVYGGGSLLDLSENGSKKIHFRDDVSLMAVTAGAIEQGFQPLFQLSAEGSSKDLTFEVPRDCFDAGTDIVAAAINRNLGAFLEQLPAGIFSVTAKLHLSESTVPVCRFWYWQGLKYVSETEGFVCSGVPGNILVNKLEGLEIDGTDICWKSGNSGSEARIHTEASHDALVFRKPGIHLQLQDDAHTEHVSLGETLLISHDDTRDLLIKTSGYERWTISSDNTELTTLDCHRKDYVVRISTAAGESRHLTAQRSGNHPPVALVTLVRPNEATGIVIDRPSTPEPLYRAEFNVAQGILSLGVSEADFLSQKLPDDTQVVEIPLPDVGTETSVRLSSGITITVNSGNNGAFKLTVTSALSVLTEKLMMLDFLYRKREGGKWFPLQYAESVGSSPMRLVVAPLRYEIEEPELWWRLVAHADRAGSAQAQALIAQLGSVSNDELSCYLNLLQQAISFKYPEPVWNDAMKRGTSSWPEQALNIIGKARFSPLDDSAAIWARSAVQEIEDRSASRYAPLVAGSVFSAQPGIYAQPPEKFDSDGESLVVRSFHCAAMVGKAATLGAFFHSPEARSIWGQYIAQFPNIVAMFANPAHLSGTLNFNDYFKDLHRGVLRGEGYYRNQTTEALLSPFHFIAASGKLNQRIAHFEMIARQDDGNHPLARLLRTIAAMHQAFGVIQGECQALLRYPHGFFDGPQWDHVTGMGASFPGVEGQWGNKIIQIVMLVTGMSRLTGYGLKTGSWLDSKLTSLLNPGNTARGMEQGIRVIHSLAPEFFAYFHLFWTLALKDQD